MGGNAFGMWVNHGEHNGGTLRAQRDACGMGENTADTFGMGVNTFGIGLNAESRSTLRYACGMGLNHRGTEA
jgi:hypothetical protein